MRYAAILLCLFLAGCGPSTVGKSICPDITITVTDSENINISPGLETLSGDSQQRVEQPTEYNNNISPDLNLSLTEAGKALAAATIAGEAAEIAGEVVEITTAPSKLTVLNTYETGQYEDGRYRYLFRGTMEELPSELTIRLNGKDLYKVNRVGDRWEGPNGALLKNSHGRTDSITLLLPVELSQGKATLVY